MSQTVLKAEERVAFALRSLYKQYGYLPYKMSKFELYDLYAKNKDFLRGGGVITFNDTDGKLLALKPDVTLSIIKNGNDCEKQKVYYHENVYRISGETKQFKELMQVGLECVGVEGEYDLYETLFLAAASLREISENFVLDIAHLGVLAGVLEELGGDEKFNREVMRLLAEKNLHETQSLCESVGIDKDKTEKLLTIVRSYGDMNDVLKAIEPICANGKAAEAYQELQSLCSLLKTCPFAKNIRLDFSVVNDMKYYNGLVFKGFVDGVCEGVLSGGQYDGLMKRMGRNARAIGFAVYLDLLDGFKKAKKEVDVDTLVLIGENTAPAKIAAAVETLVKEGKSVRVQREKGKLRAAEILDLTGGKV